MSQGDWGKYGNCEQHKRYMVPVSPKLRRRCRCGCRKRATHHGMANGVGLATGCELSIRRWVRDGAKAVFAQKRLAEKRKQV